MNETELFEMVGRKQAALEALNTEYDRLLLLLSRVVSGEVPANCVTVDLAGRKWEVTTAAENVDKE